MNYLQGRLQCGILLLLLFTLGQTAYTQIDSIHWIPPAYAFAGMGPQYIYLTTPEEQPFPVSIRDGAGVLVETAVISNSQPFLYKLSDDESQILIPGNKLEKPLQGYGLVIDGPKKFYAYLRVHDKGELHAGQLTCKGRAALGTVFRIGNPYQTHDKSGQRSNFFSIMATEDFTEVTLSGFDPAAIVSGQSPLTIKLQRGECVVFAHRVASVGEDGQPVNGFLGALLKSSKPVVVNCGGWLNAPTVYIEANDIGIDQIVPFERLGKEYILCRGGGPTTLEHPMVIAHVDGTQVWINGETSPTAVLDGGKYLYIPTNRYSPDGNMYIRTSEPAYVFQITGGVLNGKYSLRSGGFMFVPPINCSVGNTLNYTYKPSKIGDNIKLDGGMTVVALRDSAISVQINGTPVSMGPPADVPGNPDFVTYRNLDLFLHTKATSLLTASVVSGGVVQVAFIERYLDVGFSAFYSGYQERPPKVHITLAGDGICPDTLFAAGFFEGVQWVYDDSVFQYGPGTMFVVAAPGKYKAVGYIGGCLHTATTIDSIVVPLAAPSFPYTRQEPSCFGYADGWIEFGTVVGGAPPYQYSIDFGQHFSSAMFFSGVQAGLHKLVVQDVSGCYNQPVRLNIGQPDSFYINLVAWNVPDPLISGNLAALEAIPSQPVSATAWTPDDGKGCADCLNYDIWPEQTTWITVMAWDTTGCPATDSLLLIVDPRIYTPNAIAPRSQQGNDRFALFSEDPLPVRWLRVYDRWGSQVFERTAFFTNNPDDGWDGRFQGKVVTPGVYVFIAEVELEPGRTTILRGSVAVMH